MIKKNVKLISIDAMNTLIRLRESPGIVYTRFAQNYEVDREMPCYAFNKGGAIVWWSQVVQHCFLHASNNKTLLQELALKLYDHYSRIEPWTLVDDRAIECLKALKSRGYFIAITSNFDSRLRSLLQEFGIISHVDFLALSGELGVSKPDPAIFEALLKRFDLKSPNEILHIGDDYEKDYLAARNFGSSAYLIAQDSVKYNIDQKEIIQGVIDLNRQS
uniref:Haloacid dehalogenase-like hydrolase domain-containing protein 3 n=1 Tax=Acrobeloides nanus TaxID=290746 RepID=A0A914CLM2_9BILA